MDISAYCLDLARALAHQGLLNEYLWAISPEEDRLLDELQDTLLRSAESSAVLIANDVYLLAAFRPLALIEPLGRWAIATVSFEGAINGRNQERNEGERDFVADLNILVLDRLREEEIAVGIPDITPITDVVSALVRTQYEANPYPPWNSLAYFDPIDSAEQVLREIAPNTPSLPSLPSAPRVLIAGCGAGRQPIQAAMTYRGASILAIDLSLPSLAYAKSKASALGIDAI
jgi:hypothetical protein